MGTDSSSKTSETYSNSEDGHTESRTCTPSSSSCSETNSHSPSSQFSKESCLKRYKAIPSDQNLNCLSRNSEVTFFPKVLSSNKDYLLVDRSKRHLLHKAYDSIKGE